MQLGLAVGPLLALSTPRWWVILNLGRLMPHGMDDQGARELLLAPVRCQASWEDAAEPATRAAPACRRRSGGDAPRGCARWPAVRQPRSRGYASGPPVNQRLRRLRFPKSGRCSGKKTCLWPPGTGAR